MLPIIFIAPIIQLLILANAATYEIRDIKIVAIDKDITLTSHKLISKLEGSPYFLVKDVVTSTEEGLEYLRNNGADLVLEIPSNFETGLVKREQVKMQLSVNAIDGIKAGLGSAYLQGIAMEFGASLIPSNQPMSIKRARLAGLNISTANWYNPELDYKTFMVPGILVLLVTMIGTFLTGMNVVREKEIGTIEQLNVTPIKKYQFVIGKLFPFLVIALFELGFGLLLAKLIYDIPIVGSIWLIFAFSLAYLLVVLGIGLLISTMTETQQQAMFISWFFMVIFILMSGLFTPIENMPIWAQNITYFNPVRYFIEVMRMVMLKGSGFSEVARHFAIVTGYGIAILGLAVWRYRKVT
jgi:ABC-2 type transport system permease protein